ncbi:small-conductance mechanosensitive channel [Georgenia soli]|uniref:Small-conductance mechanosensitive channel n=1 Tax=Georgenia soli TaxID=638953 RepID=A0A2A9EN68_9MICO|nr:mechanosensitive ion channel domain-containing protein [Georgenia soli]PFG40243.1 small-conductance mechanosensitive channel [Georgenia soli]
MDQDTVGDTVGETVEQTVEFLTIVLWVGGGIVAGLLAAIMVASVTRVVARGRPIAGFIRQRCRRPLQLMLATVGAWIGLVVAYPVVQGQEAAAPLWRRVAEHGLLIVEIAAVTWFVAGLVRVAEDMVLAKVGEGAVSTRARRVQTQSQVMRRVGVAVVAVLGVSAILLTFPGARAAGASILASAGVISVVAGLAAQTTLGNVFAGLQLAFTDAIRVDDIVIVEGEFGYIEEITMTYVVVRLWDDRRMIMPSTHFTENPFENWTRHAPALLGGVELDLDWRVPVPAMRAELDRLLAATDLWDGRVGILQVQDATNGVIRIRALVSGKDATSLTDLKYYLREALVDWVQTNAPYALPRSRYEHDVVELMDNAAELDRGQLASDVAELASDAAELAALDGAGHLPQDDTLLAPPLPEDTDIRKARAVAARRARRRADREDRRRAREHGGRLPSGHRPRPSGDSTEVMDLGELEAARQASEGRVAGPDGAEEPEIPVSRPLRRTPVRERTGRASAEQARERTAVLGATTTTGHESSLFTGSPEAEERAQAFSGPGEHVYEEREQTAERRAADERASDDRATHAGRAADDDGDGDGDRVRRPADAERRAPAEDSPTRILGRDATHDADDG